MKKVAKGAKNRRRRATSAEPSKASLRAMPERKAGAKTKPNKFAKRVAKEGGLRLEFEGEEARWIPAPQGRPKKGKAVEPSRPHTVRLPDHVWAQLKRRAAARGVGVHTLLRELVAAYLKRAA